MYPMCCSFSLVTFQTGDITPNDDPDHVYNRSLAISPDDSISLSPIHEKEEPAVFDLSLDDRIHVIRTGHYGTWVESKNVTGLYKLEFKSAANFTDTADRWELFNFDKGITLFEFKGYTFWHLCKLEQDTYYRLYWTQR
ncbi:hypothetical protein NEOLI_005267 [Neolecta irregularis DAH-3]|uniref:Uncharacterized protein n=1 Tax=Neolecta irregularis (strain DAH-3) TaxID=1198029 RepID=A0A1U7LK94_NEOID|nr:hypothetical protein NEOLI_005267 [Neolecta irregularis DAH-3]|eukprot:OLL23013.1 hypothetical protein NEOLI_005267 [Neolecta irregularis DAH-3]